MDDGVIEKPSYEELEKRVAFLEDRLKVSTEIDNERTGMDAYRFMLSPLLRLTLDNVPDLIWVKGMDNRYLFANQAACDKLYKCEKSEDIIGKTDAYLLDHEQTAGYEHTFGELCLESDILVQRTGRPCHVREAGKIRGKELILDVTKAPIMSSDGVIVGTVGCGRDITKAEKTEQALKKASTFIRELSDELDCVAVQGYDQNRLVTLWNKASELLYGYTKEEAIGNRLEDLIIPEEMKAQVIHAHRRWLDFGEKIPSGELILRNKQGEPVHVFSSHVLKETSYGQEMFCVDLNIAPLKQAEEERRILQIQLQQAQKMEAIGALSGGIAHDFNNILGIILGYADLGLERCGVVEPSFTEEFEQILVAGERAKKLVTQILDFSRQREVDVVPVLPGLVIKEALKMLRSSLPTTIEIQSDIDMDSGYIQADPTQIHQLCMNLCTNANHAMEAMGGILCVTVQRVDVGTKASYCSPSMISGEYIQVSVSDTGSGMTKEVKEKIFDPYFTTKDIGEGTGMGLSIVHTIVKNYNGYIECESDPGKGATFHIFLPVIDGNKTQKTEKSETELDLHGDERILFVDDELLLGDIARAMLEPFGYTVATYNSVDVAYTQFTRQPEAYDLVVSDFTMPGMDGLEFAEKIREHRPDIPIVLCTGNDSKVTMEMVRDAGIDAYTLKPLHTKVLATLVRKVLNDRSKY